MKKILILAIFLAPLFLSSCSLKKTSLENKSLPPTGSVACTAEAIMCPDGSSVGRTGPNCEFAPCPQGNAGSQTEKKESEQSLIVKVYFNNSSLNPNSQDCSKVFPLERIIPVNDNVAQASIVELVKGPSEQEKADGYVSLFSEKTKDIIIKVKFENDTAYVNLKDVRQIIPNASASCGSAEFFAEMESTLKQFPSIKKVVFAINGKPSVFYEWLQVGCTPENNLCNEAPFN